MHELRMVYDEIGSDITHFLKLYRLSKKERINSQHIVSLLRIANNDLPALERRYHRLKKDIVLLEVEKQKSEQIGSQVRILAKMLEDYNQQIKELHRKKVGLDALMSSGRYEKVRQTVEGEVSKILSERRDLLKLAVSSVVQSIIRDPGKYNFLVSSNIYNGAQHAASHPYIEVYRAFI